MFFNVFGRRLSNVSLGGTPDVFERPRPDLDFTFSQRLPQNWKIKVSVKNLLDSEYRESYLIGGEELDYFSYKPGRTFTFGFTYAL